MRGRTFGIALALCMLVSVAPALASNVYWARPTGSDTPTCASIKSTGTANAPGTAPASYGTIHGAATCATTPGDILNVRGDAGAYTGATHQIKTDANCLGTCLTSGTGDSVRTIIQGNPGDPIPVIQTPFWFYTNPTHLRAYLTIQGLIIDGINEAVDHGGCSIGLSGGQHVRIINMEVKNSFNAGICSFDASGVSVAHEIQHNLLHDAGRDGNGYSVYLYGENSLVENNTTYNNAGEAIQMWGATSTGPGSSDNSIVRGNYIDRMINSNQPGFSVNDCLGIVTTGANTLVYNNVIDMRGCPPGSQSGGIVTGYLTGGYTQGYNNVIIGAQQWAIIMSLFAPSNGDDWKNNIFINSANGSLKNYTGGTFTADHNACPSGGSPITGCGTSSVTIAAVTDCTVSTSDFHLKAGAPCINAGATVAAVTTDFGGVTRPQGSAYDIGAFEFAGGDVTPPTAPSSLVATPVSGTQINLAWTASTDNVGVTNYLIESCQGAGCVNFSQVGTSVGTTFSDTGLTTTVTYRYRVRATDAAANLSGYSNTATATTLDTIAPTTPTGLTATAPSSSQINLSWTASTDNVAVTAYLVERCQGVGCSSFAQITSLAGTSLTDTGLTQLTTYQYRVRARDAANNLSAYSNTASAATPASDQTPPTVPTNLHFVSHTNSSITMAWTASTDNVAVAGYQVFQCQGSSCTPTVQVGSPITTTFTDSPLPCLASSVSPYTYTVRTLDPTGNLSAQSAPLTATVLSCTLAPLPPSNVSLAAIADYSRTQITWTQAGAGPPDTYRMDCGMTSGNPTFSKVVTGITLAAFIKDVLPGQGQWFCVVVATTSNVDSSVSNEVVTDVVGPGFGAWGFSY